MDHWRRASLQVVHAFGNVPSDGDTQLPWKLLSWYALTRQRMQQMTQVAARQVLEYHAWIGLKHHSLELDKVGMLQTTISSISQSREMCEWFLHP